MKKIVFILMTFIIGMAIGSISYTKFLNKQNGNKKIVVNYPLPEIVEEKRQTTKDAIIFNILLTGHGGLGHSGGGLMDAIIVVSVNVTDKKAGIISIPRDFWFSGHKVNADPSLKDAITGIIGLPISNTVSIDFNSFVKMIDLIGGITVDVKKAYIDNFYPVRGRENDLCGFTNEKIEEVHKLYTGFELEKQFNCRYETISYGIGLNNMTGEMALKYVRSRHGGSDFERSRHQFEVLKAILQKANISSVEKIFDFVDTNFTLESVTKMISKIGNPLEYSVSYLGLSDQNVLLQSKSATGAFILIPKDNIDLKEFVKSNL